MTIQYQNNRTGETWDVTELVSTAKWTTTRRGSPGKLQLNLLQTDEVTWVEGGIVTYLEEERGLFYGYVFQISRSHAETVEILAYDQLRYLKNKEIYQRSGVRADEVLTTIAQNFELEIGTLPNTGYVIPHMEEVNATLFDIVLKAMELTLVHSGRMFYLWDNFGALSIGEVVRPQSMLVIGEDSLATGFEYQTSIDSETYNKIKLVRDNKETGERDVYISQDSKTMAHWGILQHHETVAEEMNEAQIKERSNQMLELHNRPTRTLSLSAIGAVGVRAGEVIYVALPAIHVEDAFLVEEVSHDLVAETMQLKVKVI